MRQSIFFSLSHTRSHVLSSFLIHTCVVDTDDTSLFDATCEGDLSAVLQVLDAMNLGKTNRSSSASSSGGVVSESSQQLLLEAAVDGQITTTTTTTSPSLADIPDAHTLPPINTRFPPDGRTALNQACVNNDTEVAIALLDGWFHFYVSLSDMKIYPQCLCICISWRVCLCER